MHTKTHSFRAFHWSLCAVAAAALTACGGGTESPSSKSLTVSGVVAKGIAVGAKVSVYATQNGQRMEPALATFATDKAGRYSMTIPAQSTPLVLEADLEGATISNEADGSTFIGLKGDKLAAALPVISTDISRATVNLTPFSSMAVAAAIRAGKLTNDDVNAANGAIIKLLGVDVLTASPTENAALKAALTEVSKTASSGTSSHIQAVLANLNKTVVKTESGYSANVDVIKSTVCDAVSPTETGVCKNTFDAAANAPTPVISLSHLDKAKALFKDLRTTANAVSNSGKTGELDGSVERIRDAANKAVGAIDGDTIKLISSALSTQESDGLYTRFVSGQSTQVFQHLGGSEWRWDGTRHVEIPRITCHLQVAQLNADGNGYLDTGIPASPTAEDKNKINAISCSENPLLANITDPDNPSIKYYHRLVLFPQADGHFKYQSQVRFADLSTSTAAGSSSSTRYSNSFTGTGYYTHPSKYVMTAQFQGDMAPGFGALKEATLAGWKALGVQKVNVALSAAPVAGSTLTTINLTNGLFTLTNKDGSLHSQLELTGGATGDTTLPDNTTITTFAAAIRGTIPAARITGAINLTDSATTKNGQQMPQKASFTGTVEEQEGSAYRSLLTGTATATLTGVRTFDSALENSINNFIGKAVTFDGKLTLKSQPDISLKLSANNSKPDQGTATGQFTWGNTGRSLAINALWTDKDTGQIEVLSNDGIKFTALKNQNVSDVTSNDTLVGRVDLKARKVTYLDGTFEQY